MNNFEDYPSYELLRWLKVHKLGFMMRYEAMSCEIDRGYIKACDNIESELKRLLEEHEDGIN